MLACHANGTDLSLLVGYTVSGEFENVDTNTAVKVDETPSYALAIDFPYRNRTDQRLGLYLSHQATEFASDADLTDSDVAITHLQFTAMTLWPQLRWEPFILLGIGAVYYAPDDSSLKSLTRISAQVAGGVNYKVTDNVLLRAGVRWVPTFFDGSGAAFCDGGCSLGISGTVWSQVVVDTGLQFRF
jgi:opacity protein-like surface antigen